jgi:hypothetical protein
VQLWCADSSSAKSARPARYPAIELSFSIIVELAVNDRENVTQFGETE